MSTSTHRARVIVDNDFSGDPDDLFQLAHHVLSPSVTIPFVVASHLSPGDPMDPTATQAENAAVIARDLLQRMDSGIDVVAGSNVATMTDAGHGSAAAAARIVEEALRDDPVPLYYAAGGGLTDLAAAIESEPAICERMTVVWIGGDPYHLDSLGPATPPRVEYNLAIDLDAARRVFASKMPLWQVPSDAYRQCLVSAIELERRVRRTGELGAFLAEAIDRVRDMQPVGAGRAETYCLGDNPLVLLTALQSFYRPDPSSSDWTWQPARRILDSGGYGGPLPDARPIRVAKRLDTRLMLEDFFLKLAEFDGA